ncbi:MAG: Rho termination factor N-terminal domain-containing protein, partial [Candidatus Nanopelagicaceae bacterium]
MSDTATKARKDITDLSSMAVADLRKTANNLGIEGAADMKKAELVKAIGDLQAANREAARLEREAKREERMARRQEKLAKKDSRENESDGSANEMNQNTRDDYDNENSESDNSSRERND